MSRPKPAEHAVPPRPGDAIVQSPDWYKDAVIYQTHIKAFFDGNGDGIGDFDGLISKLDYIQELGVSAIWLLPFYPSPLRDDGYDISDYRTVNAAYGTLKDVRRLVQEAHKRGLRVVTELVINHTSDQHPWFQRARRAKPGSIARDYYVWSDSDKKYDGTRIIFVDTEKSNWTWDHEAGAYFWHRFYSHQPDLNFDNPRVMKEVLAALHYWLEMGIDGLRLDAIPYLVEREGTSCENLPETHTVLKRIRAEIDAHFPGRMLLAEANQWPEDTYPYFGDGDECHMAFHFPLMPRMYMAIAQEDRHAITDIMRQTPEIPESCQWAIFLRNHDELTLEMVTQNERDYLWNTYAADRRMRINLGIRRRLAPLLENDRRRIELLNALLLSMPGTPVIYYGDEIGMGDNIYLGDRDGVRTPMQWSPDRNGGFSRANPQQLYAPPIQDPIFGYQAVNVEAQQQSPGSLLNWMKRLIAVRQASADLRPRHASPSSTRATARSWPICASTRARRSCASTISPATPRPAIWSSAAFATGCRSSCWAAPPSHRSPTPTIASRCPATAFTGWRWPRPASSTAGISRRRSRCRNSSPSSCTTTTRPSATAAAGGISPGRCCRSICPSSTGSWPVRSNPCGSARAGELRGRTGNYLLAELESCRRVSRRNVHLLPFAVTWGEESLAPGAPLLPYTLAKVRRGPKIGALYDATYADDFARTLLRLMHAEHQFAVGDFDLSCQCIGPHVTLDVAHEAPVRRLGAAESNTSRGGRRAAAAQDLSAGGAGYPPGARDGPVPDQCGWVRPYAAAPGYDRGHGPRWHGYGTGRRFRLHRQPGQWLVVDRRSPRPGARGSAAHPRSQPAAGGVAA